jgi:hypothetical protein
MAETAVDEGYLAIDSPRQAPGKANKAEMAVWFSLLSSEYREQRDGRQELAVGGEQLTTIITAQQQ